MRGFCTALALAAVGMVGCQDSNHGSGVSHESGVMASLAANANITQAEASTYKADVRNGWAVAYDPAEPPGCVPGGLASGGPPIAERPCRAYVLERLKMTWKLRAVGFPGSVEVPDGAPGDLGAQERLEYLGGP